MPHKKNKLYSIGELAKISGISIVTIRHYDDIGLLKPCFINPESNYRYYSEQELFWLKVIDNLKYNHFSLPQIKKIIEARSIKEIIEIFSESKLMLEKQIDDLIKAKERVTSRISIFNDILELENNHYWEAPKPEIKTIPDRKIIFIRNQDQYNMQTVFNSALELFKIAKKNNIYLIEPSMTIFHDDLFNIKKNSFDHEVCYQYNGELSTDNDFCKTLLSGKYVSIMFKGDIESTIQTYYPILLDFIKQNNLKIIGPAIKKLKVTYIYVKSLKETIAELQIPVQEQD